MARLGAGDTGGETIEEDVKDSTSGGDAGADTSVEDKQEQIRRTGDRDTSVTEPEPEPEPDPAPTYTPEPQQPARGRGDPTSGPSSTAPEPAPEPQQPARGRGDEGSAPEADTGGFEETGPVSSNTAADLNRRISRARRNLRQEQQEARNRQITEQMDEGVAMANRQISRQRQNFEQAQQEQFGDADLSVGNISLLEEEEQRQAAEQFSRFSAGVGSFLSGGAGEYVEATLKGQDVETVEDLEEVMEDADRTPAAEAYGDFSRGMVEIANVPQLAVTGTELTEYGIYSADEIAEGNLDKLGEESREAAIDRGQAVVDYAEENPAEIAGTGAGALVGSAAIMGGAGRISSRAGTASRYAIQPGEEIAGKLGNVGTRAIAGERTAQRLFPDNEPLIFSEEAAIRTGRSIKGRFDDLEYQPASVRAQPSRLAQEMKSTRFKAEEALRSDAPTRVNTDINTRYLDRIKAEYTGAKFKAAEIMSDDVPTRVETERGQMQLGKLGTRSESEMADAEVTQELGTSTRQVEMETEQADQRIKQAQRSEVTARSEFDVPKVEVDIFEDTGADMMLESAQAQEVRLDQEPTQPIDLEAPQTETEIGIENEIETGVETEVETETKLEQELEMEQEFEQELELELKTETEAETRRELEGDPDSRRRGDMDETMFGAIDTDTFDNPVLAPDELGQFEEDLLRDL